MGLRNYRHNYDDRRVYETAITNLSKDECLAIIYYLFVISKDVPNSRIIENDRFPKMILRLTKALDLRERFASVLHQYIDCMIKDDQLHLLPVVDDTEENDEGEILSRRAMIRKRNREACIYEEDDEICSMCDFYDASEAERDYYRIMSMKNAGTYSQLLYYTFFSNAKVNINTFHETAPARFVKNALALSKVMFLKKELELNDLEAGYLLIRYRKACVELFDELCNVLTKNSFELYTKVLNIKKSEFSKIVRPDQKIRQFGFINEDRILNSSLLECIESQDLSLYFADCIKPITLDNTYDIKSFCVPEQNSAIYKSMLKSSNPISMLLYGQPGSGKTEYAKALIKETGKKALIFKNEAEVFDKNEALGRLNCLLSLNRKDTVLIIDEADNLLSTTMMTLFGPVPSSKCKGIVNKMLETSQNKVIWIVNHKTLMDESTLRRFTVSYKFEAMSPCMLESIAEKKLDKLSVSDNTKKDILKMLSQYKVTGASVDNMVKAISSMKSKNEELLTQNVEIVLKDNAMLLHGKSKMRETVNSAYDISVLNTSINAEKIMKMLRNAKNFADKNPGTGAIRMLFYGLSGTGKTEFARYISQALGKKILLKRASDIFDKYVGGTEEKIAAAFSEAAANDMILLWDEADSFVGDRSNANSNYERTQVNEFLTQLEEFPGIVICTTNLRHIMDPAMLRRFHITVDVKALTEEGIRTLLHSYFPEYSFDDEMVHNLSKYETVTPGDFGRISGTIRFMDPEEINAKYIYDELCSIQHEKNMKGGYSSLGKIGFCA